MKKNIIVLITFLALGITSCDKFLEEDFYSASSIETQIATEEGYETLINACYVTTKVWYGKEYGWDMTTVGTDCWTYAGDADDMRNLAQYTTMYNSQWPSRIGVVWSELYKGLNTCNAAIAYMPDAPFDDAKKLIREGEVRFLRALYLWHIVETWGNVAFSNKPITEPEYEMHRSDVEVFYTQILNDLDTAILYLPPSLGNNDYGRAHKYAAQALRARANLYWASEYMKGNTYDGKVYSSIGGRNHIQQAIDDAKAVIEDGDYELYDTYTDVWDMELNSSSANENSENIWAVNYSQSIYAEMNVDPAEYDAILSGGDPKPFNDREGGNQGHLMFGMRWFAIGGGRTFLKDDGIGLTETEPTRPFCRYMPTRFLIELYNTDVDQRFYGSFNTVFYANNPDTSRYYKWEEVEDLADGTEWDVPAELEGKKYFDYMDSAFVMFRDNQVPDHLKVVRGTSSLPWYVHKDRGYFFLNLDDMYEADGTIKEDITNQRRSYFDLSKWY
ncbi:MAG: RagB/SusD family nutrient uptake outer membrane protein, partial [Bacteroidales bacterium]|nr:RagB/SusD family nutrient uptake outer membrane protein [Bacteroidales bacterium]